jgi:hypothetical protein
MISGCCACRSLLGSLRTEERLVTRSQSVPFCCASSASLPQPPCLHLDAVAWSILCRGHVKGLMILLSGYLAGCGGKHCRGNVSGRVFRLGQGIALPRVPSPPIPSRTEWTFLFVSVVFWGLSATHSSLSRFVQVKVVQQLSGKKRKFSNMLRESGDEWCIPPFPEVQDSSTKPTTVFRHLLGEHGEHFARALVYIAGPLSVSYHTRIAH